MTEQEIERCLERLSTCKAADIMNFDYAGTLAYIQRLKAENAALYKAFEWALDRGDDVCGKCAYYIPPRPDEDYTDCGHYGECVKGIVEYFKKNG